MQQIAYEYARRKANLVLVARREHRLFGIRENACILGARQVLVIAADVVKEDDCRRFISDTISYFGQCEFFFSITIGANIMHFYPCYLSKCSMLVSSLFSTC
jgi:NAD(P)-dependent dehydrogenase (short-subunit alcohol dehydrogenase family)